LQVRGIPENLPYSIFLLGSISILVTGQEKQSKKCEGTLFYKGYTVDVLDLPGIYSLTTYSIEDLISREHIINQHPDCVVNNVDSNKSRKKPDFHTSASGTAKPCHSAF
jgi:ferrous iron transport protein B